MIPFLLIPLGCDCIYECQLRKNNPPTGNDFCCSSKRYNEECGECNECQDEYAKNQVQDTLKEPLTAEDTERGELNELEKEEEPLNGDSMIKVPEVHTQIYPIIQQNINANTDNYQQNPYA